MSTKTLTKYCVVAEFHQHNLLYQITRSANR